MSSIPINPKFSSGEILVSPKVLAAGIAYESFLQRHLAGDWGDLSSEDISANTHALEHHEELLSQYRLIVYGTVDELAIMTENDRSETVIFLLSESDFT